MDSHGNFGLVRDSALHSHVQAPVVLGRYPVQTIAHYHFPALQFLAIGVAFDYILYDPFVNGMYIVCVVYIVLVVYCVCSVVHDLFVHVHVHVHVVVVDRLDSDNDHVFLCI